MTQKLVIEKPTLGAPPRGIFLPSMIWTTDREVVAAEKKRLLVLHKRLNAVVNSAHHAEECATWLMMAEESLYQLDRDIDALYDWLDGAERAAQRGRP